MKIALKSIYSGKIVTMWDTGELRADRDAIGPGEEFELIVLDAPPVPPEPPEPTPPNPTPPHSSDAIDFSQAIITRESPDVRGWPITTTMTSIEIPAPEGEVMNPHFTKRNGSGAWPFMPGPEGGDIQYTLWIGCRIGGLWYFSGSILCISRSETDNYCPTGPTLRPGQIPNNWYYYAGSPLATYQPKPGEQVAWLVTSGVQRRADMHIVAERSNVVLTPFSPGTFTY